MTPNTKRGARGFGLPPASAPGNPGENELLPLTVGELERLGLSPREVALDGGFQTKASAEALGPLTPERTSIAGRASPGSRRTQTAARPLPPRLRGSHLSNAGTGSGAAARKAPRASAPGTGWALFASNSET